jgi:hypothetical protein
MDEKTSNEPLYSHITSVQKENLNTDFQKEIKKNFVEIQKEESEKKVHFTEAKIRSPTNLDHALLRTLNLELDKKFELDNKTVDNVLNAIAEYFDMESINDEASKIIVKGMVGNMMNSVLRKNQSESPMEVLQRLGLDRLNYLVLKALRQSGPMYMEEMEKGLIDEEHLECKT